MKFEILLANPDPDPSNPEGETIIEKITQEDIGQPYEGMNPRNAAWTVLLDRLEHMNLLHLAHSIRVLDDREEKQHLDYHRVCKCGHFAGKHWHYKEACSDIHCSCLLFQDPSSPNLA